MITAVPPCFKVHIWGHISQIVELWILDVVALGNKASVGGGVSGGEGCWFSPGKEGGEKRLSPPLQICSVCFTESSHKLTNA